METNTEKLIEALQLLSESIDSVDGIANAVIFEAAQRLQEFKSANESATSSLILARNERDEARTDVRLLKRDVDKLLQENWQLGTDRDKARAELKRLKTELAQAISERTPHDYGLLASQRDDYRDRLCASIKETQEARVEVGRLEIINKEVLEANYRMGTARPEPSRLEIAAMLLSGFAASDTSVIHNKYNFVLTEADALIAAAKKVAK